jgi:hypothetical protein
MKKATHNNLKLMYWIVGIVFLVFAVPNVTNFKERRYFSDERRIEEARLHYNFSKLGDSITLAPGPYYGRNSVGKFFLGQKQRDLWTEPVRAKVFNFEEVKGGLTPVDFGGGQQTISIKLEDKEGKKWALRSVNKDQKAALPGIFRITFMRFLIRDQLASANPYAQLVVPVLANAIGVHHTTPEIYFVPYNDKYGKFNDRMAGRLVYLEESLSSSWKNRERFGSPKDILDTQEMMKMQQEEKVAIDTLLYLKMRLFDMLISDWDRHEGNLEWALTTENQTKVFEPIPKDRDNALYQFDEGLVSHITLVFAPKLQSFRTEFGKVSGLMHQSKELDRNILGSTPKESFIAVAEQIQTSLTDETIRKAFLKYPPNVYAMVGKQHQDILKARLAALPGVAEEFYRLVLKARKD